MCKAENSCHTMFLFCYHGSNYQYFEENYCLLTQQKYYGKVFSSPIQEVSLCAQMQLFPMMFRQSYSSSKTAQQLSWQKKKIYFSAESHLKYLLKEAQI